MGSSTSTVKSTKKVMTDAEWELDVMGFNEKDLKKLRKYFDRASAGDDTDEANIKRMMVSFGLETNKFIAHAFSMVLSPHGGVSFRDVVVMFFYFCTLVDDVPLGMILIMRISCF
jgi:hypothetical protein